MKSKATLLILYKNSFIHFSLFTQSEIFLSKNTFYFFIHKLSCIAVTSCGSFFFLFLILRLVLDSVYFLPLPKKRM